MTIKRLSHYYGDIVRIIFIIIGISMLLWMSVMSNELGIPIGFSIFAVLILGVAAGFTNPTNKASLILNVVVSLFGLACFLYFSYYSFEFNLSNNIEMLNKLAAALFLVASYLSVKSLRGSVVPEIEE